MRLIGNERGLSSALFLVLLTAIASGQETTRVSVDSSGAEGNDSSWWGGAMSADGRIVAFWGLASNLVPGDTNYEEDVFVRDRSTGITERISVSSSGAEGNDQSGWPAISADGRVVAFQSRATNLVAGDTKGHSDIFVHDRTTGLTERVSVNSSGAEATGGSFLPAISPDGRVVAFQSLASNLVPGDTKGHPDIFVHDRSTGLTERVSVNPSGAEANGWSSESAISADGRVVAFSSYARNLVPGDTNNRSDVFVHHRSTGLTERVSVDSSGTEGNSGSGYPALSAEGQLVAFYSKASNLVAGDTNFVSDAFVHELPCDADASWSNYGAGFPGSNGIPPFTSRTDPVLGTRLILDLGNSYGNDTAALLLAGYQEASIPTNRGGTLLLVPVLTLPLYVRWIGSTIEAGIPDENQFCGLEVYLQVLEVDPGAAKGVSFTAGLNLLLGSE